MVNLRAQNAGHQRDSAVRLQRQAEDRASTLDDRVSDLERHNRHMRSRVEDADTLFAVLDAVDLS